MSHEWKKYQDETAIFFRSVGMDAITDAKVVGVRSSHDVDVLVRSNQAGFDILWVVECKRWQTKVSKLHVLALRQIVTDVGADRGILLSESGFQSGAVEASELTNVRVASLEEIKKRTKGEIVSLRLKELFNRFTTASEDYGEIPKEVRINMGLESQGRALGLPGLSGLMMVRVVDDLLKQTLRGQFPVSIHCDHRMAIPQLPEWIESAECALKVLEPIVQEIERRIRSWRLSRLPPPTSRLPGKGLTRPPQSPRLPA